MIETGDDVDMARAGSRKKSKSTATTEKPKKSVTRMVNQPAAQAITKVVRPCLPVEAFMNNHPMATIRKRYVPRPKEPVVAA